MYRKQRKSRRLMHIPSSKQTTLGTWYFNRLRIEYVALLYDFRA